MKEFFARLNSTERRFVIAVMIVIFFILNLLFVWPRFKDWDELVRRLNKARITEADRKSAIDKSDALKPKLADLEKQDAFVPPEDQDTEFSRTITSQAAESGVNILSSVMIRQQQTTNQFFSERAMSVNLSADEPQLVNFLYHLGAGNSMIRVRDLTLNPEMPNRYKLQANLKLVASFQKKSAARIASPTNAPPPKAAPMPAAKSPPARGDARTTNSATAPPPAVIPGRPPRNNPSTPIKP